MKTKMLLLFMAALLISSLSFSQTETNKTKVYYAIIVREYYSDAKKILFDVTDSSVMLMDQKDSSIHSVGYRQIEEIRIRKKGTTGAAIAVGTIGGTLLGLTIGAAIAPPPDPNAFIFDPHDFYAPSGAGIGLFVGAITGAVIGSQIHKVIVVNHHAETFSKSVTEIKKYCQK